MSKQLAFQGRSQLKVDITHVRTPKTAKKLKIWTIIEDSTLVSSHETSLIFLN